MGWNCVNANQNVEGKPWVSIGVSRKGKYAQTKIVMSKSIVAYLGVQDGEKIMLRRGEGDHEGWIQIQKAPRWFDRGFTLTNRKTAAGNLSFRVAAGHLGMIPHPTQKITTDNASVVLTDSPEECVPCIQIEIPGSMRGAAKAHTSERRSFRSVSSRRRP
jgi:hypothetical protein